MALSPATSWKPAVGAETTWRPRASTPDEYEANASDGMTYVQRPSGDWRVLAAPSQTHTDLGPHGESDIPAEAVVDNKVFIYVDGIHQTLAMQKDQIADLLHHMAPNSPSVWVHQPVVAIHQGMGRNQADCTTRVVGDMEMLKTLQSHLLPLPAARLAFRWDRAAKAVHDTVRQSLQAGHDVQLMVHSGGGAEAALALHILAREGYRDDISRHVRILSCSAPVSRKDYEKTGVQADNIFCSGDTRDFVYQIGSRYIGAWSQFITVPPRLYGFYKAWKRGLEDQHHDVRITFAHNQAGQGNAIQAYLTGGDGGDHIFTGE